jgi:ABC-type Fe3+ transport system permease subunit
VSLAASCGWTLARSLAVALVAAPIAWWLRDRISALDRRRQIVLWTLLLAPFFTPALLTGFGYSRLSLSLLRHPIWHELLYATLIGLRLIPVATLVMSFAPLPPVSATALHCARLRAAGARGRLARLRYLSPFLVRGPVRDTFPAFAVVFLLVFQEFETASLMGATSWTVWLFDAQAGGLLLGESLQRSFGPAAIEVVVLGIFLAFAARSHLLPAARRPFAGRVSRRQDQAVWLLAVVACGVVTGVPLFRVGRDAVFGITSLFETPQMLDEIATAVGFGVSSGTLAMLLAAGSRTLAANRPSEWARRCGTAIGIALSVPGLLGSLVVSLGTVWLFQQRPLAALYDTPLPAAVALTLFLLPRAMLLQMLFAALAPTAGVYLARLLSSADEGPRRKMAADLIWRLRWRQQFLAAGMLCIWGYLELTPVAILAPPGLTSAPVRLYNLMHYGRSYIVSALTLVAMLVPPLLLALSFALRRLVRIR